MAERRPPLPVPQGPPPPLEHFWRLFIDACKYVNAGHDGLPAPHVHTDSDGTVADPADGGGSDRMFTYFSMGA